MDKTILITGGLGYIGSHLALRLLSNNYNVVIIDNKSNNYVDDISGAKVYIGDVQNQRPLKDIFENHNIDCVIHLAALKNIRESEKNLNLYYDVNVLGTFSLILESHCKNIIFASSASVYGHSKFKCSVRSKLKPDNNYAKTKVISERDLNQLDDYNITILRIFNPIGFKFKGNSKSANLIDKICDSIKNKKELIVYNQGKDVRDYIYIDDLISEICKCINNKGFKIKNIGTGIGTETSQIIEMFPEIKTFIKYDESNSPIKLVSKNKIKSTKTLPEVIKEIKEVMEL